MRRLALFSLASLIALAGPQPVAAQRGDCEFVRGESVRRLAGPGGTDILFVSGPLEVHCGSDIVIIADSAHSTGPELRLVGNVSYQDSVQTMTSDFATYQRDIGRVTARGDVVVRDRAGPSVVRGSELQYDRVTSTRPEANIIVRGRPRAYLYEEGTPVLPPGMEPSPGMRIVGGDTIPAALQVDADRLELRGESRILAHGRVQLIRENMRAFADQADYDRIAGRMELVGSGRVEGEGYELYGDRIVATLVDDELEHVLSEGSAQLLGEDVDVRAPVIDIGLAAGDVERMVAVSHVDGVQANAVAQDFTLIADSIQVDAPGSELERLTAIGNAFGERTADSLSAGLPELIRTDWLRGDTIVGTFIRLAADTVTAEGDTSEVALESLTATGTARSLYRMEPANDDASRQAVNYITATQISLAFAEGEVVSVSTIGPVEGVHLEPVRAARAEPEDADPDDADPADVDAPAPTGATTPRETGETR